MREVRIVSWGKPSTWEWDEWTHVAVSFDGHVSRFFVNGKLKSEMEGLGPVRDNGAPLFVGAEPSRSVKKPTSLFRGSIDEVRISNISRYAKDFEPPWDHRSDRYTILLFHFDNYNGKVFSDRSGKGNHGQPYGEPVLVTEPR